MNLDEKKKDWFVRYNHICGKRQTDKQKTKFIKAMMIDLNQIRQDIHVVEGSNPSHKSVVSRNLYVGDVKTANKVIATYYDTPNSYLGSYFFFDNKKQEKATLRFNILASLVILILGIIFTLGFTIPYYNYGGNFGWPVVGMMVVYFILSGLLSHFSKGHPVARNLVRNTSSILLMLDMIQALNSSKEVAFAFVDNGTTNNHGLQLLMKSVSSEASVIYLDSIGAHESLYQKNNLTFKVLKAEDQVKKSGLTVIGAGVKQGEDLVLTKSESNNRQLNKSNLDQLFSQLAQF